jgi:hypothetical protein
LQLLFLYQLLYLQSFSFSSIIFCSHRSGKVEEDVMSAAVDRLEILLMEKSIPN